MSDLILIIKTTTGKTCTRYLVRQNYDTLENLQEYGESALAQMKSHMSEDEQTEIGNFAGCAVCDASILDIPGTDRDTDISIVDGVVINAKES